MPVVENLKIRTEISEDFDEEIIIRSKHMNDKISRLQSLISDFLGGSAEIMLRLAMRLLYTVSRHSFL